MIKKINETNTKLMQNLQSSNNDLSKKLSEVEQKDQELMDARNKLNQSKEENKLVKTNMVNLQKEQTNLIVKINEHKTNVNKLVE